MSERSLPWAWLSPRESAVSGVLGDAAAAPAGDCPGDGRDQARVPCGTAPYSAVLTSAGSALHMATTAARPQAPSACASQAGSPQRRQAMFPNRSGHPPRTHPRW